MSFLSTIMVVYWAFGVPMGIMVSVFYGLYLWPVFGSYILLSAWLGLNFGFAIVLNKARKHDRDHAFDDRLSQEKMDRATNWWIKLHKEDVEE